MLQSGLNAANPQPTTSAASSAALAAQHWRTRCQLLVSAMFKLETLHTQRPDSNVHQRRA